MASVEVVRFEVPGEPGTKGRPRMTRTGRAYTPKETVEAERRVIDALIETDPTVVVEDDRFEYEVVLRFYSQGGRRRDIDNMAKLVLDALNHRVWADDAQVVRMEAEKVHGPPRTEVVISRCDIDDRPILACARCGQPFRRYDSWSKRKHCTRECVALAKRSPVTRHCWRCGTKVIMDPDRSRRTVHAACRSTHELSVARAREDRPRG